MSVLKNKENTFTEKNRFLVYSDQLNATRKQILENAEEMIFRSAIQTFEDEGETIMATDASYLARLTVDGKAVQNGTPTPESPKAIRTVRSINLFGVPIAAYLTGTDYMILNSGSGTAFVAHIEQNTDYTVSSYLFTGANRFRVILFDTDPRLHYGERYEAGHFRNVVTNNSPNAVETKTFNSGSFEWVVLGMSTSSVAYNADAHGQVEEGQTATQYMPIGSIGLTVGGFVTPINLQGNVLASLPDGTKDVLAVDSAGHCVIEKHISHIASYNGESVGSVYLSTTGELTTGAEVYYKASSTSTVDCGYISMPSIPEGASISITAQVTPTIAAKWWTRNQSEVASAFSAISSDLASIQSQIDSIDARVTALESANSKALVLEKPETLKEISEEIEETGEQEEMPLEDAEE